MYFYQHAATRSHSQPLAATCSHSIGCKWLQVAASVRNWSKWPQVAASGRKWLLHILPSEWPQVAAFGQINFHPQSNPPGSLNLSMCGIHEVLRDLLSTEGSADSSFRRVNPLGMPSRDALCRT